MTGTPTVRSRWRRLLAFAGPALAAAAVMVAAWQRLSYFRLDRGFWRDEIVLVLSLDQFSYAGLTGRLLGSQSAPVAWLWLERALLQAHDGSPAWARLPALVSGLLVLPAIVALCRLAGISWWASALSLLPLMFAPLVVFYTALVKPYTWDMLAVSVLLGLAALDHRRRGQRWWIALVVGSIVLPWTSVGAMLSAPAILAWTFLDSVRGGRTAGAPSRSWHRRTAALIPAAVSIALAAWHSAATTAGDANLRKAWLSAFSPLVTDVPVTPLSMGRWLVSVPVEVFRRVSYGHLPWLLTLLVMVGAGILVYRRRFVGILMLLPAASCLLASAAGIYPMADRLALFTLPGLLVGLAALPDAVADLVRRLAPPGVSTAATAATAVVCVLALALGGTGRLWSPPRTLAPTLKYTLGTVDYRTTFRSLAQRRAPNDIVLINIADRPAALYYGLRYHIPLDRFVVWTSTNHPARRPVSTTCRLPVRLAEGSALWALSADRPLLFGQAPRDWIRPNVLQQYTAVHRLDVDAVTLDSFMPGPTPGVEPSPCLVFVDINQNGSDVWWSNDAGTGG